MFVVSLEPYSFPMASACFTIDAREGKTRHSFQGIGHTTYLCFARKAFFDRGSKKSSKKSEPKTKKTVISRKKTVKKSS